MTLQQSLAPPVEENENKDPVVVPEELWNDWINPKSPPDLINEMINDSIQRFNFHPVSNLVNNPRNDSPALTDPV